MEQIFIYNDNVIITGKVYKISFGSNKEFLIMNDYLGLHCRQLTKLKAVTFLTIIVFSSSVPSGYSVVILNYTSIKHIVTRHMKAYYYIQTSI